MNTTIEELMLPVPSPDYSEANYYLELLEEVDQWNQGVWDAITACHPDIQEIESADESYRQGFIAGLDHRLMKKKPVAPFSSPELVPF